jgi:hypothetical protein
MMRLFYLFFFLIVSISSVAQFSLGVKTGIALSSYRVKTNYDDDVRKGGLAAGLTALNTLGENIAISGDILYVQKGYNHQICNQCYDKFTSVFIEVPLSIRYMFYLNKLLPSLKNFKVHAVGGIYMARWLTAKYETKIFDAKSSEDYSFTGEKRFDFGPNFGGALEYTLFTGSMLLDFRYSAGVTDMSPPGSTTASKNKSLLIGLSYLKSF